MTPTFDHRDVRRRLADGADSAEYEIAEHLGTCAECRAWQQDLTRILTAAPTLLAPSDDGTDLTTRTLGAVRTARQHDRRRTATAWVSATAAALVLLITAAVLITDRSSSSDRLADIASGYE